MKNLILISVCASFAMVTLGCTAFEAEKQDPKTEKQVINVDQILKDKTSTDSQKSEKLALAGEQLITPSGFMYASEIFDSALKLDAKNVRAQLYQHILSPMMYSRGVLGRVQTLSMKDGTTRKNYVRYVSQLKPGAIRDFLIGGPDDIRTEADIQKFTDGLAKEYESLRIYLKSMKETNLTLHLNSYWALARKLQAAGKELDCDWDEDSQTYTLNCGAEVLYVEMAEPTDVELNRADNEVFQHAAAGTQIALALLNAYDLAGATDVAVKYQKSARVNKLAWMELTKDPAFGTLRSSAPLKAIPELGLDGVAGARFVQKMQASLCPMGYESYGQRPGTAFDSGICLNEAFVRPSLSSILKSVELALTNNPIEIWVDDTTSTLIKPTALIDSPIKDLKSLGPQFDRCDQLTSITDVKFNGALPNGDANQLLAMQKPCVP